MILDWILCNVFNKHFWCWFGTQDLYGNPYYQCERCDRVKYKSYDEEMVRVKRQEIYNNIGKVGNLVQYKTETDDILK